eukprot:9626612-Lingulodinium_polyedra.AAC.1
MPATPRLIASVTASWARSAAFVKNDAPVPKSERRRPYARRRPTGIRWASAAAARRRRLAPLASP